MDSGKGRKKAEEQCGWKGLWLQGSKGVSTSCGIKINIDQLRKGEKTERK